MIDLAPIHTLRQAGEHEAARQQLLDLVAQHPTDPEVHYATAAVHDFLGLEREALPFYHAAIEHGLSGATLRGAYLGLGSTYRALGEYESSKQIFLEGLQRFPEAGELRVFLAMTLYNLGEHHEAMALLLSVLTEEERDPEILRYARAIRFYAEDLDQQWP